MAWDEENNTNNGVLLDRINAFMVDDFPQLAPSAFSVYKPVTSEYSLVGNRKVPVVEILEHGTDKFSKVLRFMYSVPDSFHGHVTRLVAVINPCLELDQKLFGDKNQYRGLE